MAVMRRHPTRSTRINGIYMVFTVAREGISDVWYAKLRKESRLKGENFSQPLIPDWEVKAEYFTYGAGKRTVKEIEMKNGNRILFSVSGDKNTWSRIQGKDFVLGVVIDEQAGTQELLDEIASRFPDADSNPQVLAECGGAWLLWPATETMVNPAYDAYKRRCEEGAKGFEMFTISPSENPAITTEAREGLRTMMSEESFDIRMGGTGSAIGNMLVYSQFSDSRHMREMDYLPRPEDSLWCGYDPGTNWTGIVFGAISPDKPRKLRIVKCIQARRQTLEADVQDMMDFLKGRALEGFVYDQAARKIDKAANASVAGRLQQLFISRGVRIHRGMIKGDSIYERGIPRVRYFLDPKPGDPLAEPLIEINNSQESGCQRLRQQFLAYHFSKNSMELKGDNIVRGDDHILDATRYLIGAQPCWTKRPLNIIDEHYAASPKRDISVPSDAELNERNKLRISALIAKGRIPMVNYRLRH